VNRLRSVWRTAKRLALSGLGWVTIHGTALAAAEEKENGGGGGSWVLSYALVILCVALGLAVILHPSKRRDRAKPEVYDEGKKLHG
jgi:hypothetical protein